MSRISQDFINSVGYLYEEINIQQNDFLNEESEYYDEEASELVEDIIATISTSMIYEGYSAEGIIGFLADSSEESIIEKYLSFDENILTESNVSEEYIVEQLEILDLAISEGLGSLAGKVATGIGKLFVKRAPALKSAGPLTQNAATKLAMKGKPTLFTKAKVGLERAIGPKGRKAVQAVKDITSKAKAALPAIAKGALIGGTGVLAGYMGAKLGSGDGEKGSAKPTPAGPPSLKAKQDYAASKGKYYSSSDQKTYKNYNDALAAKNSRRGVKPTPTPTPAAPSSPTLKPGLGDNVLAAPARKSTPSIKSEKPKVADKAPEGETAMQKWARANPKLADRVKPGQSGYDEISAKRTKPGPAEKQDQTPTQGSPDAKVDPKAVNDAIKAQQERDKNRAKPQAVNASYEYDAYDLVLEYLFSQGHVETLEEANYVMLVMDAETIGSIVEGVMPEPIDPTAHNKSQRFATQQGKIRSLEAGAATSGEKSAAQSKLKGPQLPGV